MNEPLLSEDQRDALQEIANIGMGLAGARLATLLGTFVHLSVPSIRSIRVDDLANVLSSTFGDRDDLTAVRQAFACDVRGEAIVLLRDDAGGNLWDLMGYDAAADSLDEAAEAEVLMDVSNLITGAYLSCVFDQLGRSVNFSPPTMMGRHTSLLTLLRPGSLLWDVALLVEVNFSIEDRTFVAQLIMLTAEDSIAELKAALDELLEAI